MRKKRFLLTATFLSLLFVSSAWSLEFKEESGLMSLTRAIDTVIITLCNDKSEFANRLHKLSEQMNDFVEWID